LRYRIDAKLREQFLDLFCCLPRFLRLCRTKQSFALFCFQQQLVLHVFPIANLQNLGIHIRK
jgi:hypothetical protein